MWRLPTGLSPSVVVNPQTSRRRDACTRRSSDAGEPMAARAGRTRLWVLIEHPGPWPASAPDGVLPDAVTDAVDAARSDVRVLLIRRARRRHIERPLCILAWSDGIRSWMREGSLGDYGELTDLPFETIAAGTEPAFGRPRRTPVFAVCTHGKKDACCAELGRPILAALTSSEDADAWECTHVGGDRFAANMVVLPDGLYFSRLGADSARDVVDAYLSGILALPHLRGRAAFSLPAQAAEHAARRAGGITAVDALEYLRETAAPDSDSTTVEVHLAQRRFRVVVRAGEPQTPFHHGCGAGAQVAWHRWIVEELQEVSKGSPG
ncbi:sucrase ferredoxin [Rhodococcus ruber]|nr:sucrase ferredoxin [Rhodococcus ruber]RQM33502.1 sucrase ferredoxin [Rhodococcus ruber]